MFLGVFRKIAVTTLAWSDEWYFGLLEVDDGRGGDVQDSGAGCALRPV